MRTDPGLGRSQDYTDKELKLHLPCLLKTLPWWEFRGFIIGNVTREFQAKYKQSLLGAAWTVINPLSMIIVYTVIFSSIMQAKLPGVTASQPNRYSIYICAGLLTWGLFTEIVGRALNIFIDNANLLKKISFPRICLPIIVVLSSGINFSIIFCIFTIYLLLSGNFPGVTYVAVLPLLTILVAFAMGLGVTLGILNVFFRDIGQLFGIFLQFWFWLTPIVYSIRILPIKAQVLLKYNPMASVIEGFQNVLVSGMWPHWGKLVYPTVLAIALCFSASRLFHKHIGDMVDEL